MKRCLFYYCIICTLLLSACAAAGPEPAAEAPALDGAPQSNAALHPKFLQPTFYLESLPELAPFETPREIIKRYSEVEFVDTLQPAADYGRLYPYEGKFVGPNLWENQTYYGLVDAQGRIVVDPVYRLADYITPVEDGEPAYLMLAYPVDKNDEAAQKLLLDSYGDIQLSRVVFASADGTWVSDTFYGDGGRIGEDRIIINYRNENAENPLVDRSFCLYDLAGRLITKCDGYPHGFHEGLSLVYHEEYDDQTDEYRDFFNYIDRNGRVAIAGPYSYAENFVNGRANVILSGSGLRGTIDEQGVFIEKSRATEEIRYGSCGEYILFSEGNLNSNYYGLKTIEGNIIAPALYTSISSTDKADESMAVATKKDGSYWFIDLNSGLESIIDIAGASIRSAQMCANNWCIVSYNKAGADGLYRSGVVLFRDEIEYYFKASYSTVYCFYLQGDLFALEYDKFSQNCYTDIFDVTSGTVIKNIPGCYYSDNLGDLMIFNEPAKQSRLIFNRDFQPLFVTDDLGGDTLKDNWQHVADDVYSIRTSFYSGLIKENGQWLIRVYANNKD
jgi:hypothetical protein